MVAGQRTVDAPLEANPNVNPMSYEGKERQVVAAVAGNTLMVYLLWRIAKGRAHASACAPGSRD